MTFLLRGRAGAAALMVCAALLLFALRAGAAAPQRVLFVGNSLTYTYGVPYLFEKIAEDLYGRSLVVHSLMSAGGRLSQAVGDENMLRRLRRNPYDVVILQERGALLLCAVQPPGLASRDCRSSISAHRVLAAAAAKPGALTVLLGTPQLSERVAAALVRGESAVQAAAGIDRYVAFAPTFDAARAAFPDMAWLTPDGEYPGPASALLLAFMTARTVFGEPPHRNALLTYVRTRRSPSAPLSYHVLLTDTAAYRDSGRMEVSQQRLERLAGAVGAGG